jgi:hypothetical protein
MVSLAATLCAVVALSSVCADSAILFSRGTPVPRSVQRFAGLVIAERCNYQAYERTQRSFWAYQTRARRVDGNVAYSISIVAERMWMKTEPAAYIEMTIVDDGQLRLTALRSSFISCSL